MSKPETITIDDRFDKYVIPITESGCHIWTGATTGKYGTFWNGEKYISTHRYSWMRVNGEIPQNMNILHKCDIPCCVNPNHLFCGTQSENIVDAIRKNRYNKTIRAIGEKSGRAVLTEAQAIYILRSSMTTAQLSRELDISFQTLSSLRNGKSWKHLKRN